MHVYINIHTHIHILGLSVRLTEGAGVMPKYCPMAWPIPRVGSYATVDWLPLGSVICVCVCVCVQTYM